MKTQTRIYIVAAEGEGKKLVRAATQAAAIRHVAKKYSAEVASQDDLVALIGEGLKVEPAGG